MDLKDIPAEISFEIFRRAFKYSRGIIKPEVKLERLEICNSCEHCVTERAECKLCGCGLLPKTNNALETCPIGKWKESQDLWKKWAEDGYPEEFAVLDMSCCEDSIL